MAEDTAVWEVVETHKASRPERLKGSGVSTDIVSVREVVRATVPGNALAGAGFPKPL
jgi:hypothetical protein